MSVGAARAARQPSTRASYSPAAEPTELWLRWPARRAHIATACGGLGRMHCPPRRLESAPALGMRAGPRGACRATHPQVPQPEPLLRFLRPPRLALHRRHCRLEQPLEVARCGRSLACVVHRWRPHEAPARAHRAARRPPRAAPLSSSPPFPSPLPSAHAPLRPAPHPAPRAPSGPSQQPACARTRRWPSELPSFGVPDFEQDHIKTGQRSSTDTILMVPKQRIRV